MSNLEQAWREGFNSGERWRSQVQDFWRTHDYGQSPKEPANPYAPEAPAQVGWFERNAVFVITEAYEAGVGKGMQAAQRGEEVQNPWGDEPCREAWALGYKEGKERYRPEAPAQADPLENLTSIQEELRLYDDYPIPPQWREAMKVALESGRELIAAEKAYNEARGGPWVYKNVPHAISSRLHLAWQAHHAVLAHIDTLVGSSA